MKRSVLISMAMILLAVGALAPMPAQAFVLQSFDVPGATTTKGRGINDDGDIVGRFQKPADTKTYGFLKEGDTYTEIMVSGSSQTIGYDINNSGVVVGSYITTAWGGFTWTSGGGFSYFSKSGASIT